MNRLRFLSGVASQFLQFCKAVSSYSGIPDLPEYDPENADDIAIVRKQGFDVLHDPLFNKVRCAFVPMVLLCAQCESTGSLPQAVGIKRRTLSALA